MADFNSCFESMMLNEGGYKLHTVEGDRGGMTYAGIARKANPSWAGWRYIDAGDTPPTQLVRDFYKVNYWNVIRGDEIIDQAAARMIFDFGVNAGWKTSTKLAQIILGTQPDGVVGPKTLQALNSVNSEVFVLKFTLAKVVRYRDIVAKDRTQLKFLLGWLNRTIREAA